MPTKSQQLQIRVTPQQKAAQKRQARAAGLDVSSYVLYRLVPDSPGRLTAILSSLEAGSDPRYVLAELNDYLTACPPMAFAEAVAIANVSRLSPHLQNYFAAMVEQAADMKGVAPPGWVRDVKPLDAPHFVTPLKSLRNHLLHSSPVPFKRRNIFIDAGIGARV